MSQWYTSALCGHPSNNWTRGAAPGIPTTLGFAAARVHAHHQSIRFFGYRTSTRRSFRRDDDNEMGLATTTTSGFGVEASAPRGRSIVDNWMPSTSVKLRCDWPRIASLLLQLKKYAVDVVTSYITHSDILNSDKQWRRAVHESNGGQAKLTISL